MRSSRRGVAQPGSALAWGARGREFESRRPDHAEPMWLVVFSKQIESVSTVFAALAQLVEHLTCNQGVVSSNPTGGTNTDGPYSDVRPVSFVPQKDICSAKIQIWLQVDCRRSPALICISSCH